MKHRQNIIDTFPNSWVPIKCSQLNFSWSNKNFSCSGEVLSVDISLSHEPNEEI